MRTQEEVLNSMKALATVLAENPDLDDVQAAALSMATFAAVLENDSVYNDYEMPPKTPTLGEMVSAKYGKSPKKGTRERENKQLDYALRWKYSITLEDYQALMIAQYFSCAICKQAFESKSNGRQKQSRPHVDHRHSDGKVRGLLCGNCNRGLGYFRDDPNIAEAAAEYLIKHA